MKKSIQLVVFVLLTYNVTGQAKEGVISIGEEVPDVVIGNLINYEKEEVRLSEFRGKWVILDFWATWCAPCISMFPKTEVLQEQFANDVQFISVTYEGKEQVKRLFSKIKKLKELHPVISASDDQLRHMFPHKELPHYVWIDRRGVVRAITGMKEINADELQKAIEQRELELKEKKFVEVPFDMSRPFLIDGNGGGADRIISHSIFTGYIEGIKSFMRIYPEDKNGTVRYLGVNLPAWWIMRMAYSEDKYYFGENRIMFEVEDKGKFKPQDKDTDFREWYAGGNGYCYELILPSSMSDKAYGIMQEDMKRYFPQYEVYVEKRMRPVLALVRTSYEDKIKSRGGEKVTSVNAYQAILKNQVLLALTRMLEIKYMQHLPTPVIDQTGYYGTVDIQFEADMSDPEAVRQALQKYDLDLIEKEAEIDVLVIKDKK